MISTSSSKKSPKKSWIILASVCVFIIIFIPVYQFLPNTSYNQSIVQKAIDQKNPVLCTLLFGSTTDTYALPLLPEHSQPNQGSNTYAQIEYFGRCIDQAQHGSSYVY